MQLCLTSAVRQRHIEKLIELAFWVVFLELGVDNADKFQELYHSSVIKTHSIVATSLAHHLPHIFADAFNSFLRQEVKPPLRVFIFPTFIIFYHSHVISVFTRTAGYVRQSSILETEWNQ